MIRGGLGRVLDYSPHACANAPVRHLTEKSPQPLPVEGVAMAKSKAELKRLERERAALNLLPCPSWISGWVFEVLIDKGAMTEAEAADTERRASWVKMIVEGCVEDYLKKMSHCDTQGV